MANLIKISGGSNANIQGKALFNATPTYNIGRSLSAVNEGSSVTFTLSTTNVANGTVLPYTITGISANDVTTGSLTGTFTVNSGLATTTITMSADQLTEGAETATLTLNNAAASNFVVVNDTSVFTPTLISGLQLWLDAADSSTLFDATAGGSLVSVGGTVARWQDKSGNNRHAIQGTVNNRPIKNGSALYFNGSTSFFDYLNGYSLNLGKGASGTLVCMASGNGTSILMNERTSTSVGFGLFYLSNNKIAYQVDPTVAAPYYYEVSPSASGNANQLNFYAANYIVPNTNSGTLSATFCTNGTFQTVTNNSYTTSLGGASNPFTSLEIGRYKNHTYGTYWFTGSISKILYYNRNLTQAEITSLYQNL